MPSMQSMFSAMFDQITDGACVSDLKKGVLFLNPAAEAMLGVTLAEARGKSLCDLLCGRLEAHGGGNCKSECGLLSLPARGTAVTLNGRQQSHPAFQWKDGRMHRTELKRNLRVRCQEMPLPLSGTMGEETHLTIIEDASEATELLKQKEDWRAMLVHDLRSPLSNVFTVLRSIQDGSIKPASSDSSADELVEISVRSCRRMLELLNLYLDVGKLEAGKMPVKLSRVDLVGIADLVVEEQCPAAKAKTQAVSVRIEKGLTATADPELLSRVIQNLLNNAIKFTPEGGEIEISAARLSGSQIALSVNDSGPGIAPDAIPRLFDRFFQAKARRQGSLQGTGLGLAFCREALRMMGGEVSVHTKLGEGSRFTITLPAAEP